VELVSISYTLVVQWAIIGAACAAIFGLSVLGHRRIVRQRVLLRELRAETEQVLVVLDQQALTLQDRCTCGYLHSVRGARKRLLDTRSALEREEARWE
jgi:hypothetical protein